MNKHIEEPLARDIRGKAVRKIHAKRKGDQSIWAGLGMMGLIGWSVAIPVCLGALLGMYLDKRFPGAYSWTLTFLFAGLAAGCVNAWLWVLKERAAIREEEED